MIEYESIGSNLILPYLMAESLDKNFFKIKDEFKNWMDNYAKVYQTNHRSNVNGFQSPDDFYMEKSFSPFLNYMSERILDLVDEFKLNEESSINCIPRLSNMWFNINYTGSYNTAHTHPGSILAGVLYVDVPKDSGDIQFSHHDFHNLTLVQHTDVTIEPIDGMMLLFPSSLQHSVDVNCSDKSRYSIAFNLYEYYEEDSARRAWPSDSDR